MATGLRNPGANRIGALTVSAAAPYVLGMSAHQSFRTAVRVVIAVTALYALAMQSILGGLLPVSFDGPLHRLCLQVVDAGEDGPAKLPPNHSHLSCCTAAHVQPALDVPHLAVTSVAWPPRPAISVAWRPEVVSIPRAPPRAHAAARAPPVV